MPPSARLAPPQVFGPVHVHLGEKSGKYPDGNQVLVHGADRTLAFDTPQVARRLLPQLQRANLIVLSHVHEDHMVALGRLSQLPVQVHHADLAALQSWDGLARHYGYPPDALAAVQQMTRRDFDYQPRPDATGYADGTVWELGGGVRVRAHHLPGHTAGHCALVEESSGTAFIGDIDLTGFGPYYGDATSDLAQFRRSLARVRELDARVWITSHHRGVVTERSAFLAALDAFADKIEQRTQRLLGHLRERPHTLDELVARGLLYPPGVALPYAAAAERRTLQLHLQELLNAGAVRLAEPDHYAVAA